MTDGSSVITPANPIDDELKETKVDVTKIPGFFKEKKSQRMKKSHWLGHLIEWTSHRIWTYNLFFYEFKDC